MFDDNYDESEYITYITLTDDNIQVKYENLGMYSDGEIDGPIISYDSVIGCKIDSTALNISYCKLYGKERLFAEIKYDDNEPTLLDMEKTIKEKANLHDKKSYLVFVNSKSGSGKSINVFTDTIYPIFRSTDHTFETYLSNTPNLAEDIIIAKGGRINEYSSIILVGGDGTFHTIAQTIVKNNINIPISIIPVGSGNGIAMSFMEQYEENATPINCLYHILNGNLQEIDVTKCTIDTLTLYSVLGQGWGFVSDVDIGSEWLRFIGRARFTVQTLINMYYMPTFKANIQYIEDTEPNRDKINYIKSTSVDPFSEDEWVKLDGDFLLLWACQVPYMSDDMLAAPDSKIGDGKLTLLVVRSGISRYQFLKLFMGLGKGSHIDSPYVTVANVLSYKLNTDSLGDKSHITIDGEDIKYNPSNELCVTIMSKKLRVLT